jgi:hypothetical protein
MDGISLTILKKKTLESTIIITRKSTIIIIRKLVSVFF